MTYNFAVQLADQSRSHPCYPEAALSSTSLLHMYESHSALWTVSSGSLATLSLLRVHGCRPLRAIEFGLVGAGDVMTNQLQENFSYLKYEQTPNKHNVYLLRYVVSIAELIYFIFILCTTCSPYFYYRGLNRLPNSSFTLGEWIS